MWNWPVRRVRYRSQWSAWKCLGTWNLRRARSRTAPTPGFSGLTALVALPTLAVIRRSARSYLPTDVIHRRLDGLEDSQSCLGEDALLPICGSVLSETAERRPGLEAETSANQEYVQNTLGQRVQMQDSPPTPPYLQKNVFRRTCCSCCPLPALAIAHTPCHHRSKSEMG